MLLFLEDKRSNKIANVQYFFKTTFIYTSLRISRPNQNHMKHIDFLKKISKSLAPSAYGKNLFRTFSLAAEYM